MEELTQDQNFVDEASVSNGFGDSESKSDGFVEQLKAKLTQKEAGDQQEEESEWIDVLGSGDLMKRVVIEGNGEKPNAGELVKITSKNLADRDSSPEELQFILGHGFSFDAFDVAVPLMVVGELAHIKVHSRFVGDSVDGALHEYELELLDVQPADSLDLSVRINDAREAGNDYYKRGKYERACRLYDYGIGLLSNVEDEELKSRRYTLISNLAACLTKLKEWQKIVELTEDLAHATENGDKLILTKLVLRRSNALIQLKSYNRAIDSLNLCLEIDPSNTLAKSLLEQTRAASKKEETRMKSVYKKMFTALGDKDTTANQGGFKSFVTSRKIFLLAPIAALTGVFIHSIYSYVTQNQTHV